MANRYTRLSSSGTSFSQMLGRFGIVTVMNAKIYPISEVNPNDDWKEMTADQVVADLESGEHPYLCNLESLKIANVTEDGPTKSVTGGQYNNTLIKFGKTATIEIQDALGNAEALEALSGGLVEYNDEAAVQAEAKDNDFENTRIALHFTQEFSGPVAILGDSFFIDSLTGKQVPVKIIFYNVLPDSLFNLTQDAEGDASVFDMNGTLNSQTITVGNKDGVLIKQAVFYSVIDSNTENVGGESTYTVARGTEGDKNKVTFTTTSAYTATADGAPMTSGTPVEISEGSAVRVIVKNESSDVVYDNVFVYKE